MKSTFILILSSGIVLSQEAKHPVLPAGIAVKRDVEYVSGGGPRRMLDVYYPEKAAKPVPLVVWIHGGGWTKGSKDHTPALPLLEHGFAVASVNYRFSQDDVFPAQIEDCKSAVRWLRKNAPGLNIAPEKIGVWGASAGGHLVALLGVSGDVKEWDKGENLDQSSRVQAVCDWFGATDLLTFGPQAGNGRPDIPQPIPAVDGPNSPLTRLIGGAISTNPEKARAASPVSYVAGDDAPFLIMHGDKDPLVPPAQSSELQYALAKAGVPSTLVIIPGAGHGGPLFNDPGTLKRVSGFFSAQLKN